MGSLMKCLSPSPTLTNGMLDWDIKFPPLNLFNYPNKMISEIDIRDMWPMMGNPQDIGNMRYQEQINNSLAAAQIRTGTKQVGTNITGMLDERETRYGSFDNHADIAQKLKSPM